MKAQALGNNSQMGMQMMSKRTLEINPNHKIIKHLKVQLENDTLSKDIVNLMYETALLTSGFSLDKPADFGSRIYNMMSMGLNLDDNENEESVSDTDIPDVEEESMEEID